MRIKNISFLLLAVFTLGFVALTGCALFASESDSGVSNEQVEDDTRTDVITVDGKDYKLNSDIETILFMGIDKEAVSELKSHSGSNGQSDSLNLLILNKNDKTGKILQINRDTMVDIEIYSDAGEVVAYERGQIALQYAYSTTDSQSARLTTDKVSELLFNVDIRDYLALTLDGIVQAADSVGGVKITVPEDYTYIRPEFKAGETIILDGEQAEAYIRYRDIAKLDSNISRMQRQSEFLSALITQLREETDMNEYVRIYEELEPYMETNLTAEELKELSEYDISLETIKLDGKVVDGGEHAEYIVDNDVIKDFVLKTFYIPY